MSYTVGASMTMPIASCGISEVYDTLAILGACTPRLTILESSLQYAFRVVGQIIP